MWRKIWMSVVVSLAVLGATRPVRAAVVWQGCDTPHTLSQEPAARRRVSPGKRHTAVDSGMMLVFGLGLFGCASVCAVESHREERRRQRREADLGLAMPASA